MALNDCFFFPWKVFYFHFWLRLALVIIIISRPTHDWLASTAIMKHLESNISFPVKYISSKSYRNTEKSPPSLPPSNPSWLLDIYQCRGMRWTLDNGAQTDVQMCIFTYLLSFYTRQYRGRYLNSAESVWHDVELEIHSPYWGVIKAGLSGHLISQPMAIINDM